jgi:disulfide bond formation protein DsbB
MRIDRLPAPPTVSLALALIAALLLATVLALQYLAGLAPCPLCIWQRYPHLAVVVLGLIGWRWQTRPMLGLIALVLLGGAGLAGYHVGVEQGWIALPAGCAAGQGATSVEELRQMLAEAPPACDQVSFTLLGLSLAGWNLIGSLAMAGIAAWAALRPTGRTEAEPVSERLAGRRG